MGIHQNNYFFLKKLLNLDERWRISWIERKIKFFRFLFSGYGNFCSKICEFSMKFHDNSQNKNRKIDFSFHSAHCASFMKVGSKLSWEGLHILPLDRAVESFYSRELKNFILRVDSFRNRKLIVYISYSKSVRIKINRKMVNTIWFRFDQTRLKKDFSVCRPPVI